MGIGAETVKLFAGVGAKMVVANLNDENGAADNFRNLGQWWNCIFPKVNTSKSMQVMD